MTTPSNEQILKSIWILQEMVAVSLTHTTGNPNTTITRNVHDEYLVTTEEDKE